MTDERSPLDAALDLVVFAPVGLVITAAEQLPGFAEKGRARVESRVAAARIVGRFAVSQGSRELARRRSRMMDHRAGPTGPVSTGPVSTGPQDAPAMTDLRGQPPRPPTEAPLRRKAPHEGASLPGEHPTDAQLAIPGYDSLSASQVVSRLAGLTADELADVASYEAANRGRRTVMNRIRQLQG